MPLIVGLGNIGAEYENTRHNVGFKVIDALAKTLSVKLGPGRGPFHVAEGRHRGRKMILMTPDTYMNRSGLAVNKALNYYHLNPEDCLVCYDDINLPLGKIRLRKKGSAGGHNGIADIIEKLGTQNFPRLRMGIGNNFTRGHLVDYVLSPFKKHEWDTVEESIQDAHDAVLCYVREGINKAMNSYN